MKKLSKCNACMKQAEENYRNSTLSKQYYYQLLREKCTHTEEECKGEIICQD